MITNVWLQALVVLAYVATNVAILIWLVGYTVKSWRAPASAPGGSTTNQGG